jgi:hypothetical protein
MKRGLTFGEICGRNIRISRALPRGHLNRKE